MIPPTFGDFLTFIGSASAIGFVLSFVSENWKWFQSRTQQGKMAILVLISVVMGLLSYSLVRFIPAGVVEAAQPFYQAILASVVILLASQVWHQTVNKQTASSAAPLTSGVSGLLPAFGYSPLLAPPPSNTQTKATATDASTGDTLSLETKTDLTPPATLVAPVPVEQLPEPVVEPEPPVPVAPVVPPAPLPLIITTINQGKPPYAKILVDGNEYALASAAG